MEPLAPGTEDDPPIDFSSLNKQENEQERLLKQKAILKNGQYENIFELSYLNGAEHWFCKVCQCPVMGRVYQHELGKRHNINLHMTNRHLEKSPHIEEEIPQPPLDVAPGEPVPPGFESEMGREAQIQERLDNFKVGPLVALEYLVELNDYDATKEPLYLCILCDKRGDPRTVVTHLASYNHISQYLQKHFPSCYRALAPYMTKQYKRNWQSVLQKIAEAIEKKFGRLKPFSIDKDKFEKDRLQYLTMISKGRHFSEQTGYTFVELIVHDELTKSYDNDKLEHAYVASTINNWGGKSFIEKPFQKRSPSPPVVARPTKKVKPVSPNPPSKPDDSARKKPVFNKGGRGAPIPGTRRRSLSSVSSASSHDGSDSERSKRKSGGRNSPPRYQNSGRRLPYNRDGFGRRSPARNSWDKPNYYNRPKELTETQIKDREKDRLEKMQEYKKLAKAIENDMSKTLKNFERNPEKHPKYNDEWKLFWNKRYKELQMEGKDASKYDFKPEWIEFWGKRMVELHDEEVKVKKEALKKRLGLAEDPTPISFRIGNTASNSNTSNNTISNKVSKETKPSLPMAARPDNDPEVIVIDDKEDDIKNTRSHSPWERVSPPRKAKSPPRTMNKVIVPFARNTSPKESVKSAARYAPAQNPKDRSIPIRSSNRSRSRSVEFKPRERHSRERSYDRHSRDRRSRSREGVRDGRPNAREAIHDRRLSPRESIRDNRPIPRETVRDRRLSPREMVRDRRPSSRDRRSRSREPVRDRRDMGHYSRDGARSRSRERKLTPSRDRSWERERVIRRDREYRESSYERDLRRDRIRTVADLPWEREKVFRPEYDERFYAPPAVMRDATRQPVIAPEDDDDNEEVNIVSVLRLLTALEERLGSLGPKVIDLLAQALALEKKEANSSETLLDNEINCVMFETVKEKLKGQLLAGFVDMVQARAFKKAIKKTASLIFIASQRRKEREEKNPKSAPVTVPGVGAVDKAAIAKQIANALVAQGKTDVTQAELEQLINAVVGMAEASKNAGKPVTTASFIEHLDEPVKPSPPAEKIIFPSKVKDVEKPRPELIDLNLEPLSPESPDRSGSALGNMENLLDSDLQTLLQNFKDLSTDEQMNLINYLKKLEVHEPERVERLRKFVNLGKNDKEDDIEDKNNDDNNDKMVDDEIQETIDRSDRESPFSNRMDAHNPSDDQEKHHSESRNQDKVTEKIHLDSEEEDYTYEDVVKAVSTQVKNKEIAEKKKDIDLTDAKTLISNLMSSFTKTSSNSAQTSDIPVTSSADLTKTLSSINMESLASIMSSVQNKPITPESRSNLFFEPPKMNVPSDRIDMSEINFNPGPGRLMRPDTNLGPDNVRPGSGNMRTMHGNIGPASGNMGPGHVNMGATPANMGIGTGNKGLGAGSMGPGSGTGPSSMGNVGPGMRNMLPGPSNMGPAPVNRGPSPGNMRNIGGDRRFGGGMMGPGSGFGPSDSNFDQRPLIQYPTRGTNPYGNQFGSGANFSSQSNVSYPNVRGPRPPFNQNFSGNPRFGGPGNRPPGGNFNRW